MLNLKQLHQLSTKMANETDPGMLDKLKPYGKAMGMGAGAGALAGIPISLLAHALMADDDKRGLRDYLKSGLLGSLIGGGAGAVGGAGLQAYDPSKVDMAGDYVQSLLDSFKSDQKADSSTGTGLPYTSGGSPA